MCDYKKAPALFSVPGRGGFILPRPSAAPKRTSALHSLYLYTSPLCPESLHASPSADGSTILLEVTFQFTCQSAYLLREGLRVVAFLQGDHVRGQLYSHHRQQVFIVHHLRELVFTLQIHLLHTSGGLAHSSLCPHIASPERDRIFLSGYFQMDDELVRFHGFRYPFNSAKHLSTSRTKSDSRFFAAFRSSSSVETM